MTTDSSPSSRPSFGTHSRGLTRFAVNDLVVCEINNGPRKPQSWYYGRIINMTPGTATKEATYGIDKYAVVTTDNIGTPVKLEIYKSPDGAPIGRCAYSIFDVPQHALGRYIPEMHAKWFAQETWRQGRSTVLRPQIAAWGQAPH